MNANPSIRTVPYLQIKAYYDELKKDKTTLDKFMDLKAEGHLDDVEIQNKCTPLLVLIHQKLTKVLKENQIISLNSNEEIKQHVENIAKQVLKIQNKLNIQKPQQKVDVKEIIQSMQPEF